MNKENIAEAFVSYYLNGEEKDYWAIEELNELSADNPKIAWKISKEILKLEINDPSWRDNVDGAVVLGAVENIIALHSKDYLNVILTKVSSFRFSQRRKIYKINL